MPGSGTRVYNKLVRDRIPEIIEANGEHCETIILEESAFIDHLNTKLGEEIAEYHASGEVEELADVVEVIRAILDAKGMSWTSFEHLRQHKAEARGGFSRRIFLRSTSSAP